MTAYAETAATVVSLNSEDVPTLTVQDALHHALNDVSFNYVFNDQTQRGSQTPTAVAFGLTFSHGSRTLNVADCAYLIEDEGLQTRIDHYAIRAACRYLAVPDAAPRVAVKVSAETLAQTGCAHLIKDAAASAGIELDRLELEVEEHALHWRSDIEPTLRHLHELGVRIAIDRFGTGLTSLSALSHLPIATIKIDESIVYNAMGDTDVANYARAIIDVAKHLRINVVVVGATADEQRAFFEGAGCLTFQR